MRTRLASSHCLDGFPCSDGHIGQRSHIPEAPGSNRQVRLIAATRRSSMANEVKSSPLLRGSQIDREMKELRCAMSTTF